MKKSYFTIAVVCALLGSMASPSFAGKVSDVTAEDIVRTIREKRAQEIGNVPFEGFFFISLFGTKDEIAKAIKAGADVNAGDPKHGGTPPLTLAAGNNTDPGAVKVLLEAGADVNHIGKNYRRTPLHQAVLFNKNSLPIVKELLKKNPDLYIVDTEGYTPLEYAISGTVRENRSFDGVPRDDILLVLLNASTELPFTLKSQDRERYFTGQFNRYKAAYGYQDGKPNQKVIDAFKKAGAKE